MPLRQKIEVARKGCSCLWNAGARGAAALAAGEPACA